MSRYGFTVDEEAEFNRLVVLPLKKINIQLWMFGSRARGNHKKHSDVDVLFEVPKDLNIQTGFFFELKENIENSKFPYKIDLVSRAELSKEYSNQIESEKIPIE